MIRRTTVVRWFALAVFLLLAWQLWSMRSLYTSSRVRKYTAYHDPTLDAVYRQSLESGHRPRAAFAILVRNSDLFEWKQSMRQLEDHFNKKYRYPYVFLNDVPFTEEFKDHVQAMTEAECLFGEIPKEHWSYPAWIDQELAKEKRTKMQEANIIYGGSESYRHMCRYESGFFFRHPLLDPFDYFWRVEPGVQFHCDISFDPFEFMARNNKSYSFTISMYEYRETIPTLWDAVKEFKQQHPNYIHPENFESWISTDNGNTYNLCHFWSNFEIASLNFFRSEAYMAFFDYLDRKGGFFYERWGDAPVHSIATALFLSPEQVHFWDDIGYTHPPFTHCPTHKDINIHCTCDPAKSFDNDGYSCTKKYLELSGWQP